MNDTHAKRIAVTRVGLLCSTIAVLSAANCTSTTSSRPAQLTALDQRKPAPDAVLVDIASGNDVKLSDFKGQVVLLDFWATWCPPCQEPMAHNSAIMKRRAKDWKGKAVIVGISIDNSLETVRRHVKANRWQSVRQLWGKEGGSGWNSTAATAYKITGVPTALLLDRDGRIAWRGHPAEIDVEKEIDRVLKQ